MRVYNLLNTKGRAVVCIERNTTIEDAAKILAEHEIGALPVLDSDGEPIGIISERDIVRAIAKDGAEVVGKTIDESMTHRIVTCKAEDSVVDVIELMKRNNFRHLPVRDNDGLAGMISMRDLATIRLVELEMENDTLRELLAVDAA